MTTEQLRYRQQPPEIDMELVKLKAEAQDKGMLKLATWGTKEELKKALQKSD